MANAANNLRRTTSLVPANVGALSDFRNFLLLVWKHLNLPDPTPIQYDIADYLQSGPRRKVIMAFRGVGKSWITAAYVVWRLLMNPQDEFLVVSASKDRADQFSTFAKQLIDEMEELAHLHPKANQRDSKIAFDVGPHKASHSPSVKSVGITGQLTGSRADEVIFDDVEVPNNSATQTMRDLLGERVKEADAVLKPGGKVTYLGTPQSYESLYNRLPERGYEIRIWPARYPTAEERTIYGARLAPLIAQGARERTSTDPRRFSDDDLLERELSYGRSGFALQFMLDTRLSDANRYPLKLSDLVFMDLDAELAPLKIVWGSAPEQRLGDAPNFGFSGDACYRPFWVDKDFKAYTGKVMWIDPSGRGKDETAYAVVFMLHGYVFLLDWGGLIGGYDDETLTTLAKVAKEWKVNSVDIEDNFGNGMFSELFKPVLSKVDYPCTVTNYTSTGQKEPRIIDTLEPVMNRHKLVINRKLLQKDYETSVGAQDRLGDSATHYSGFWQLTHLTRDRRSLRHDDRVEALAGAVGRFVEKLAQDEDRQKAIHKNKELEKMVADLIKSAGGRYKKANLLDRYTHGRR
jgi:hypothetical protein